MAVGPARRKLALALALALGLCLAALSAGAAEGPAWGAPVPPGEPCATAPHPDWSPAEKWAWGEICQGKMADFNKRFGAVLPPGQKEAWTGVERQRRGLSAKFIETILLHQPWCGALGRQGVKIQGAHFAADLDLTSADIAHMLWLEKSRFEGSFAADNVNMAKTLSLEGSCLAKVTIVNTNIAMVLAISGQAQVLQGLVLDNLRVGSTLYLDNSRFQTACLSLASIGGWLSLAKTHVDKSLILMASQVGGHIDLDESRLPDTVFREVRAAGAVTMKSADFGRAKSLDLRDSQVGTVICDGLERWPAELKLDRFTYQYIGGMGQGEGAERMTDWPAARFVHWLARQNDYSPQPYEQCAKVLREAGQPDKADDVLFAGREHERREAWKDRKFRWLGMTLLWGVIGYGLGEGYFRSLIWASMFVWIGACVANAARVGPERGFLWLLGFSLAKLLPLVKYGDEFDRDVHGWPQVYFMFHQFMGWALASFIVAGLSGLTK